jgi:hypothetical protein
MQHLKAKSSKIQLLYTLNAFRSIQKHITLELREIGTRDRVMGDCVNVKPRDKMGKSSKGAAADTETDDGNANPTPMDNVEAAAD